MMYKDGTYKYEISFTQPIFPRRLIDMIWKDKWIRKHIRSIKDLQRKDHYYGDTYCVG